MDDIREWRGRKITAATMDENGLALIFEGGTRLDVWDAGQSCCERRYMSTDDDVQSLVGHRLLRIEDRDGPELEGSEVHESRFVEIATDGGFITLVTHNEHNGYYGGFKLSIKASGPDLRNAVPFWDKTPGF